MSASVSSRLSTRKLLVSTMVYLYNDYQGMGIENNAHGDYTTI